MNPVETNVSDAQGLLAIVIINCALVVGFAGLHLYVRPRSPGKPFVQMLAVFAMFVCGAAGITKITLARAEPAPVPTPAVTCLTADFPDSDPPRHGVCVPTEEAG